MSELETQYRQIYSDLVKYIENNTDKKIYKVLPDIKNLSPHQIDNIVSSNCMDLIQKLKRKDRDNAFVYYSTLVSKVRRENMNQITVITNQQ